MALKPPVEVPQGAIRLNTDSQKLEFFAQDQWWEMATDVPTLNGGARAFMVGGGKYPGSSWVAYNTIDMITISTAGNATDFGDLTQAVREIGGASSSRTRAVRAGGTPEPAGPATDTIDYWTMSSSGNAADFGNLTAAYLNFGASTTGSETRGIFSFGYDAPRSISNKVEYLTIASTGNTNDFGDLSVTRHTHQGASSPTRTLFFGGFTPSRKNEIDYFTNATTGNALDFGDLVRKNGRAGVCGNTTRAVYAGGEADSPISLTPLAMKVEFATKGNATDFGEVVATNREYICATSSSTRGLWSGGGPATPAWTNTISYQELATAGTGQDFGDLTNGAQSRGGMSNAHGGL